MKQKRDYYQEITDRIIEALEANPKKWESGLADLGGDFPVRATGEYYKGINVLLLWIAAGKNGFSSNQWMTYKQAQNVGGQVKKGSKGTQVVFFKMLEVKDRNTTDPEAKTKIPMLRTYTVFNADQIDDLPEKFKPVPIDQLWADIDVGEILKASSACEVKVINQTPHYAPELDYIGMPEKSKFHSADNYYRVLAHEMAHSTGHKDRLDREGITGERTKATYAFEELVAELSAVFVGEQLGIDGDLENHASYIGSWLKAMKDDKKYIFKAATAAQKASEFIMARFHKQAEQKAAA